MWENSVILKLHFLSGSQTVNKSDFKEIHCSFEPAEALLWLVSSRREGQVPSVTPTSVSAASPLPPPARRSRVSPLPLLEMSQVVTVVIVESIALRIYWATLSYQIFKIQWQIVLVIRCNSKSVVDWTLDSFYRLLSSTSGPSGLTYLASVLWLSVLQGCCWPTGQ